MKNFPTGVLALLIALLGLTGGCSDSTSQDFSGNANQARIEPRVGVLHLGASRAGLASYQVEGYDASGRLVGTARTDERGTFVMESIPADGRVDLLTPNARLSAEIGGQRFFYVTGVSTLVSRYRQANPELSVAQARERIARFLDIPNQASLRGTFGESWRSAFSWSAFVQRAGATPLDTFFNQQVQAAAEGHIAYFRQPHPYPALYSALGHRLHPGNIPNGVKLLSQVRAQDGEVAASFLKTLVDNVAADVIANEVSDGLGKAFGWLGSLLGLNKAVEIAELQQAIKDLLADVENLSVQVQIDTEQEEFDNINIALNPALIRIGQQSLNYLALANLNPSYPPDVPIVSIDPTVTAFATGLRAYASDPTDSLQDDLALLRKYLQGKGGTQNPIFLYASILQNKNGNLAPSGAYLFQDFRSNAIQEEVGKVLDYYRAYQLLGMNLLAENAHMDSSTLGLSNTQQTNTIASGIESAQTQVAMVSADLAIEGQMVPPATLFSEEVMVDCHTGTMWSLVYQGNDLAYTANTFQVYGVDEYSWSLPTETQLATLRSYALNAGNQNLIQGLTTMGFTTLPTDGSDIIVACSYGGVQYAPATAPDGSGDLSVYNLTTGVQTTYENPGSAGDYGAFFVRFCPGYTSAVDADGYPTKYLADVSQNLQAVTAPTLGFVNTNPSLLQATWPYQVAVGYSNYISIDGPNSVQMDFTGVTNDNLTVPPFWTVRSDTPSAVSISNVPEEQGTITYLQAGQSFDEQDQGEANVINSANGNPQGATSFTTTFCGIPFWQLPPFPASSTAAFTAPPAHLTSILVTPTNRVFESDLPPGGALNVNFFATGFYDNGTVEDLSFKATWSVTQSQSNGTGNASFNPNGFASTVNQLRMPATLGGTALTVTATYQDPNTSGPVSGTALVETDF